MNATSGSTVTGAYDDLGKFLNSKLAAMLLEASRDTWRKLRGRGIYILVLKTKSKKIEDFFSEAIDTLLEGWSYLTPR